MEPFASAVVGIARDHCAITDAVTIAVCGFVRINVGILIALVALHTAISILIHELGQSLRSCNALLLLRLFAIARWLCIARRPRPGSSRVLETW